MFLDCSKQSKEKSVIFHTNPPFVVLLEDERLAILQMDHKIYVLLPSSNCCNFFVRNPLRSRSTALERAAPETFENGVSFCLTPPELGDRVR